MRYMIPSMDGSRKTAVIVDVPDEPEPEYEDSQRKKEWIEIFLLAEIYGLVLFAVLITIAAILGW